jgi:hypothetical protein
MLLNKRMRSAANLWWGGKVSEECTLPVRSGFDSDKKYREAVLLFSNEVSQGSDMIASATRIQAVVRSKLQKKLLLNKKEAALKIQSLWRMAVVKKGISEIVRNVTALHQAGADPQLNRAKRRAPRIQKVELDSDQSPEECNSPSSGEKSNQARPSESAAQNDS